jgi:hypothetical protein
MYYPFSFIFKLKLSTQLIVRMPYRRRMEWIMYTIVIYVLVEEQLQK